ncbi:MAG: hypothetical protein M5R36_23460 [Deltaproteobacteria bacterium]|nr:hypothetical protein [Deltaproteobacteria bacterium]
MKKIALPVLVLFALGLALASAASADDVQAVETLIGKILERYSVPTNFGNVYFNERDIKRLVHAAANLRPINLGVFTTDMGQTVKVRANRFDRGMVTLIITH